MFWVEEVYYASYLSNQISIKVVGPLTPIEKWASKKAYVGHVGMFQHVSLENNLDNCMRKLDVKSHSYIIMGYSQVSKSYRLLTQLRNRLLLSVM